MSEHVTSLFDKPFRSVQFPHKRIAAAGGKGGYQVYKTAAEFEMVEAQTVTEALEKVKANIPNPLKVIKVGATLPSVYESGALEIIEDKKPEDAAAAATPADPGAPPADAAAALEEAAPASAAPEAAPAKETEKPA